MTARGRRFLARLVTTLVTGLAGILTVAALPATAHAVGIGQYVALGDSYAAGQGASAPDTTSTTACRARTAIPRCSTPKTRSISALTPPAPGQRRPMWPRSSCRR